MEEQILNKDIKQDAIEEIIRGIAWMIQEAVKNYVTNSYDGIIVSQSNDNKWDVQYNGRIHTISPYGSVVPSVGKMVKVIVPQGNQSLAYFI